MAYEVLKNFPIPADDCRRRDQWTEERQTMDAMEVGDCMLVPDAKKVNTVRCTATAMKPKRFTIRKLTRKEGGGWGCWRIA